MCELIIYLSKRVHVIISRTEFSPVNLTLRKLAVLEVAREDEFSPLKNAKGSPSESPETARRDLMNLHYRYIVKAGGKFMNTNG